ncbi:MAG: ribose 5-phosphate isomerase B [Clostridiales bacterium]|jgi:ribose 5-phosphate isomerase B|nr:ribose 5-phosphate isomerase B [Clostridiales bacterium]
MIVLGADHGGVSLKESVKKYLDSAKIEYRDLGTFDGQSVDYPPIAAQVGHTVADGKAEKGILFCGTGIGMSIAANKVDGVRAVVCDNDYCTEKARSHNNANILCLGGRVLDEEKAIALTKIFLGTEFEGGRHQRRVEEITAIENGKL